MMRDHPTPRRAPMQTLAEAEEAEDGEYDDYGANEPHYVVHLIPLSDHSSGS